MRKQGPEFCPNFSCHHHYGEIRTRKRWWVYDGVYDSDREGEVQRYRCNDCGKRFSDATFSLDYYAKKRVNLYRLRRMIVCGSSVRATARQLFVSPSTVTRRMVILARQSMAADAQLRDQQVRAESLVADGFQSFWVSQYHPNNFNLLCGSDSQYVYALTTVSLKRSGRMSDHQRQRRDSIERAHPSDPKGLERSFTELMSVAARLKRGDTQGEPLSLYTDEHQVYPRCLAPFGHTEVRHSRVSSTSPRSGSNPLFAVNYLDREIRKDCAEHHRETVCFARSAAMSVARMWVYLLWHNIEKPYRISPQSSITHAQAAGIRAQEVRRQRRRMLRKRAFFTRSVLCESQRRDWLQLLWTPERENRRNLRLTPWYAAA